MASAGGGVRWVTRLAVTATLVTGVAAGCGSGDSTVAKTPQASYPAASPAAPAPGPPGAPAPAADPCAVNLGAPTIAKAVSELPRDPRSQQPWNPEPVAGNYSECAQLSAVIVKANTNTEHPNTRAVLFHLGQFISQAVPDTYGFTGVDTAQSTADTVALQAPTGITGLSSVVKFHWNGSGVELIGNTAGG